MWAVSESYRSGPSLLCSRNITTLLLPKLDHQIWLSSVTSMSHTSCVYSISSTASMDMVPESSAWSTKIAPHDIQSYLLPRLPFFAASISRKLTGSQAFSCTRSCALYMFPPLQLRHHSTTLVDGLTRHLLFTHFSEI